MTFDLKKVCQKCTPATVQKYRRDILRLLRLGNPTVVKIPETSAWLKEESLFKKYKAIPLNKRRALSVAAVKAGQGYSLKDNKKWYEHMVSDVQAYKQQRSLQLKSEDERKKWPKEGIKVLKKIASEFKRSIRLALQTPNIESLYLYSQYILVKFYSEVALRNTLADVQIVKADNYLSKSKGVYTIHLSKFKASDKVGDVEFKLSKALSTAIHKYIKFRAQVKPDHNYLLVNAKGGKLSKKGLGVLLQKLTKQFTGKAFGSRLIRVLFATEHKKVLDKALKISKQMMHKDLKQTVSYARTKE